MRYAAVLLALAALLSTAFADRLVRLHQVPDGFALELLREGYDVTSVNRREGYVDIMLPDEEVEKAAMLTRNYEVLPREWGELLPENARGGGYYYDVEENWEFWCSLAAENGDLVDTPVTIGQSYEGRDIYAIEMTSPSGGYKPAIIFSSLIHAREPGGNSVLIDYANWLVDNYDGGDTEAAYILDNATLYFIPVANPDGYLYNLPGGGMHRKNMNFTEGDGVDLNRNWGYMWGYDDSGSSPYPGAATYRGTGPFSEPETQVQRDFMIDVQPIASMSYHTYGGYLLYPWGYDDFYTPDNDLFAGWASQMTADNSYSYGTAWEVLYNTNGDQMDWTYGNDDIPGTVYCMTPEVDDDGFWGSQNDSTEIVRICDECRPMNIMFCMFALNYVGIGENPVVGIEPVLALNSIYPNPVVSSAAFSVSAPSAQTLDVVIYDTSGRMVHSMRADSPGGGETTLTWAVPDEVPAGVYTATVANGAGGADTRRFTVLR